MLNVDFLQIVSACVQIPHNIHLCLVHPVHPEACHISLLAFSSNYFSFQIFPIFLSFLEFPPYGLSRSVCLFPRLQWPLLLANSVALEGFLVQAGAVEVRVFKTACTQELVRRCSYQEDFTCRFPFLAGCKPRDHIKKDWKLKIRGQESALLTHGKAHERLLARLFREASQTLNMITISSSTDRIPWRSCHLQWFRLPVQVQVHNSMYTFRLPIYI